MTGTCIHCVSMRSRPSCMLGHDPEALARAAAPEPLRDLDRSDPDLAMLWRIPCDSPAWNREMLDSMRAPALSPAAEMIRRIREALEYQATCKDFTLLSQL
jgi:hypothetical protein